MTLEKTILFSMVTIIQFSIHDILGDDLASTNITPDNPFESRNQRNQRNEHIRPYYNARKIK